MSSTSEVSEGLQYRLRYASAIFFRLHDPTDRATLGGLFESENLRQLRHVGDVALSWCHKTASSGDSFSHSCHIDLADLLDKLVAFAVVS